jgi:uncharacterized membrane protein required for colicin V production
MISLDILFYIFIFIFALIGAIRGWAKEVIATFGTILGLFILTVLEAFVPAVGAYLTSSPVQSQIGFKSIVFGFIVFCAYQTPNLPMFGQNQRFKNDRLQDVILGFLIGGANGFMIFGTIWFFVHQGNYPFSFIIEPIANTTTGNAALQLIELLPPAWLVSPFIYFAIAIAFMFVLVVFI